VMYAANDGFIALILAADTGQCEAMRLLLDHPSADPAAMMAVRSTAGISALIAAAAFAVHADPPTRSCAPLLLLLRRVAVESPCDAQKAHMTEVMEVMCQDQQLENDEEDGQEVEEGEGLFDDDRPDDARDECVRILLERGAAIFEVPLVCRPVVSRIIQEGMQLARVPQLVNEAIVGLAVARQPDQKPRDGA
jgi:hypothetical protein